MFIAMFIRPFCFAPGTIYIYIWLSQLLFLLFYKFALTLVAKSKKRKEDRESSPPVTDDQRKSKRYVYVSLFYLQDLKIRAFNSFFRDKTKRNHSPSPPPRYVQTNSQSEASLYVMCKRHKYFTTIIIRACINLVGQACGRRRRPRGQGFGAPPSAHRNPGWHFWQHRADEGQGVCPASPPIYIYIYIYISNLSLSSESCEVVRNIDILFLHGT